MAGELEARWNRALAKVGEIESRIAAHDASRSAAGVDPATLGLLASNLQTVWPAPTTDARLEKWIVRILTNKVAADIDDATSAIVLTMDWAGGAHSQMRLPRRRRGQRNSTSTDIVTAVRELVLIASDELIAGLPQRPEDRQ